MSHWRRFALFICKKMTDLILYFKNCSTVKIKKITGQAKEFAFIPRAKMFEHRAMMQGFRHVCTGK
jgi:hypothetical protein